MATSASNCDKNAEKKLLRPHGVKKKIKETLLRFHVGRVAYNFYVGILKWKMRRALHSRGYDIINEVHRLLYANGYEYFADFGMLLGFMREGGFLKHDDDIDFSIRALNVNRGMIDLLLNNGYKFSRAFVYEGRLTEISFLRHGVNVDIFFYFENHESSYYYVYMPDKSLPVDDPHWLVKRAARPCLGKPILHELHGVTTQIPENWEEMLTAHYGSWRIPDTKWNYATDPRRVAVPGHGQVVGLDQAMSMLM